MEIGETSGGVDARVLLVDSGLDWRGGQRQVLLLLRGLIESGVHVALAAPERGELYRRATAVTSDLHPVGIAGGADAVAALAIRNLIGRYRFDIVHAHDSHAHSAVSVATLGSRQGMSVVVSRRIDTVVGRNWPSALKYRRGADMFLAISNGVRNALIEGGVDPGRIRLVPSGIDLDQLNSVRPKSETRRGLGFTDSEFIVGNVGALTKEKGHASIVRAARRVCDEHPNARFVVAGDGPLRSQLDTMTRGLGLEQKVVFLGHRDDVLDVIAAFDAFVMPSTIEGLGSSIMDAQALGVPVVASNVGGIPDVVTDNETGILIEPGNNDALATAVGRIINEDDLRKRIIEAGKSQSVRYDFRRMVYNTIEAYRALVVDRKR